MKNRKKNPIEKSEPVQGHYNNIFQVSIGILSFYFVIFLYDARGIYNWSKRLPVNEWTKILSELSFDHWRLISRSGFEEPKHSIETFWLGFQGAHPLLYPKKYHQLELEDKHQMIALLKREKSGETKPIQREIFGIPQNYNNKKNKQKISDIHKTLIIGDSLMMTVGPVLREVLEKQWGSQVTLRAKLATGLARPEVFDWRREIQQLSLSGKFNVTIVLMGTNDSQDFVQDNQVLIYGTVPWVRAYRSRIQDMMAEICHNSESGIWISLPPMQSPSFNRKSARLNHWILRASEQNKCLKFLDTSYLMGNEAGQYESYKMVNGKSEKIRMSDGIHITKRGAQLLIEPIFQAFGHKTVISHAH